MRSRPTILFFNTSDTYGGAARAMQRIIESLPADRFIIKLAVKKKYSADERVIEIPRKSFILLGWEILKLIYLRLLVFRTFRTENTILHSPGYVSKLDKASVIRKINPDIIHLHWVGQNLFTVKELATLEKPLVWTFHDMWAFCGAEHVSYDDRYITGYTSQDRPATESGFDLNRWVWRRKVKAFSQIHNLHIVCPSDWMSACAKESTLFRKFPVSTIVNGLDVNLFHPADKKAARARLGLPARKRIVLFGAMDGTIDRNKGYEYLIAALNILGETKSGKNLHLVVFGNRGEMPTEIAGIPLTAVGLISSDKKLAQVYSCADVTVVPSLIESFGQAASESLACGTPVACFDTSGLKTVVDHKVNGYRAQCFSSEDLAKGIGWILSSEKNRVKLSKAARKKALTRFSLKNLSEKYCKIYEIVGQTS